jgi:EAL and modified HD-GYP domain-containing signal transduction protein
VNAQPLTAQPSAAEDILFARQPICDAKQQIVGYELRCRGRGVPTSDVLAGVFGDAGLDESVGAHKAFVDVNPNFLLKTDPMPVGPERLVLGLVEYGEPTEELLGRLRMLRSERYTIALDLHWDDPLEPLVSCIDIVKVDVRAQGVEEACRLAARLSRYDVKLIATNVENEAEQARCAAAGFELFQGYWFCAPELVHGDRVSALDGVIAAHRLASPDAGLLEIEEAVRIDAGLSVRLLRHLNSAAIALPRRVSSIRMAVLMLGEQRMKQWVMAHLMAGVGPDRPALLWTALVRARFCELLGRHRRVADPEAWFACGLLSVMDALTGRPMEEIVPDLPLSQDLRLALTARQGMMGEALRTAMRCEAGEEENLALLDAHAQAMRWADGATGHSGE